MKGNDFVVLMLRSPLHPLMGNTMLITVKGRRSGKPITTPVNYYRSGEYLWILSGRTRKWWRNIGAGVPVRIRLHGRDVTGTAQLVLGEDEVAAQLQDYLKQLPLAAKPLGIKLVKGTPDRQDVVRVASDRLFVRICLQDLVP